MVLDLQIFDLAKVDVVPVAPKTAPKDVNLLLIMALPLVWEPLETLSFFQTEIKILGFRLEV